jgi:peptidoglycan/LPS O-acetylase OafA/YrhL
MQAPGHPKAARTSWPVLAGLRFVLAWIVMGGHLPWFSHDRIGWAAPFEALGGKAAVVGFLLVSGYAIAASLSRGESGFYKRRVLRIYPLYFVAIVASIGLQALSHGRVEAPAYTFEGKSWPTALGNLLLLQTFVVKPISFDGPVWSLSVEFSYYLIAPLLWRMRRRSLVLLVLLSAACHLLPPRDDLGVVYLVLSKLNALKYLWCWVLGLLLWRERTRELEGGGKAVSIDLLALACAPLLLAGTTRTPLCLVTYLVAVVTILVARHVEIRGQAARALDYLGDISYPAYLFHVPAFIFAYAILGIRSPLALVAFAVTVSVAAYHGVDRYLKDRILKPLLLPAAPVRASVPAAVRP